MKGIRKPGTVVDQGTSKGGYQYEVRRVDGRHQPYTLWVRVFDWYTVRFSADLGEIAAALAAFTTRPQHRAEWMPVRPPAETPTPASGVSP